MIHFIGFRGEEYWGAVRVFGLPDFVHRVWDLRARRELADGDTLVFASGDPAAPSLRSGDDYSEPDDPARVELGGRHRSGRVREGDL